MKQSIISCQMIRRSNTGIRSPFFDDSVQLDEVMSPDSTDDTLPIHDRHDSNDSQTCVIGADGDRQEIRINKTRAFITTGILLLVNLLNYMDRFTVAGKSLFFSETKTNCS